MVRLPAVVRFTVLGPLGAEHDGRPVDLKGPRHRAVLARLLVARGRVVPVGRLVEDLWDDPPEGARGAVQTFVGALRKALEPDRPPRAPARVLVSSPPGYALRAAPDEVDAWRFEAAVHRAAALSAADRHPEAADLLDEALRCWQGPAYAEFTELAWARGEAARLEELRLLAVERRAEAALALGRAAACVPDLEALVQAHPLREDGWRLLALALYATGRQGDALAVLRRAREVLRAELGVDPGAGLAQLHADVLAHAPHLEVARAADGPPAQAFVGRTAELRDLERAARAAAAGGPRLVLLSGAPGAGKTTLARVLSARLAASGWTTAWGSSSDVPGAPAGWAWEQARRQLLADDEGPDPADPGPTRFARQRSAAGLLARRAGPVLVVLDDLQWADEETLSLLTALAADPDLGPVLLVGAYRSTEVSAALADALARAARTGPARLHLVGLDREEVGELARALTSAAFPAGDTGVLHARTGGNPFFVRELVGLWQAEGDAALQAVPAGVRDVLRARLARLAPPAQTHLQQAAVLGPELDVEVLTALADGQGDVLDAVDAGLRAGLLVEPGDDRLRFAHALVRETLYGDLSRARRCRWHARAADVLEALRPRDAGVVAHHLLQAGDLVPAVRVATWAGAAAQQAEARTAPHEAARLWRAALDAPDRAGTVDPRTRLDAVMGLVRTLAVTGRLQDARRHRAGAVNVVERLGDPVLTAAVLGSFDVPAVWTSNDDADLSARLVALAERTLCALPADSEAERARLLITVAMERRADPGPRGAEAAREAAQLARRLGDRTLTALALNARFLQTCQRAGLAQERGATGRELLALTTGDDALATFEVLGHLVLVQASAALADLQTADRHAQAADELAARHDLPLVGAFTAWWSALRLALTGPAPQARAAYRTAAGRLAGSGMSGLEDGLLPLALLGLDPGAAEGPPAAAWGPYAPWVRPLELLARGDRAAAQRAADDVPESPRDLLLEARTCLHALAAVRLGDRRTAQRLYDALLPAAGELAGAGSGLLTVGPTALYLGHLSDLLGRPQQAATHHRHALVLAQRAGSPHWARAAQQALGRPPEG